MERAKKFTPAMEQVRMFKEQYPDCILFMRMGDFYETFFDDASTCAKELDIVLTSRSKDPDGNPIPLAGIPYHAVDLYLPRLVRKGYKVAICEQTENPKLAKGVVKRDVIRVVTPGTAIDAEVISGSAAHYLMALCPDAKKSSLGLAFLDITTGEFFVRDCAYESSFQSLATEIEQYNPLEILVPQAISTDLIKYLASTGTVLTPVRDEYFKNGTETLNEQFKTKSLEGFDTSSPLCLSAAAACIRYVKETQKTAIPHILSFSKKYDAGCMVLDAVTLRNLEILTPLRSAGNDITLFGFLNRTKTPMGSRCLKNAVTRPLTDIQKINSRLDAVEYLTKKPMLLKSLRMSLAKLSDIERIAGRIAFGNASPRDLLSLASSLSSVPEIKTGLADSTGILKDNSADIPEFLKTAELINSAVVEDPPTVYKNGKVIKQGYSKELDNVREIVENGRDTIAELQNEERERTGIKSLKIAYNNVFGYYIEITRSNINKVPPEYERKQTTANAERFTIPKLREREALMARANEKILALEVSLYEELISKLREIVPEIQKAAICIGVIDTLCAFADLALTNNCTRPELVPEPDLLIRNGRHPIVESTVPGGYVPNDTVMSSFENQILILTGANMAGKSTYMRSVALICIMAQIGSFVPATFARVGIADRVFTRVGASDDLAGGQSTFMVEMLELANILNNSTDKSLILLDEIGRGTSTVDGYAIARSVLEYLHGKASSGPRTLFATHFHQLIGMESELKRVKNYHFAVKEDQYDITFLRKLIPGATDRSYGIHVAKIAGVPKKVLQRADEILKSSLREGTSTGSQKYYTQMLLTDDSCVSQPCEPSKIELRVKEADVNNMTPMQALLFVNELKELSEKKR